MIPPSPRFGNAWYVQAAVAEFISSYVVGVLFKDGSFKMPFLTQTGQ